MRTALLLGTVAFLGLLVFVPAIGTAGPADLVATTGIPTQLYGTVDATARSGILTITHGASSVRLQGSNLELQTIEVTSTYARVAGIEATGEYRVSESTRTVPAGAIQLQSFTREPLVAAEGSSARLQSSQAVGDQPSKDFWTRSNARLSALILDEQLGAPTPAAKTGQMVVGEATALDAAKGAYSLSTDGAATMARAERVLVYGARLVGSDGEVLAHTHRTVLEKPGGAYVPGSPGQWVGPGTHIEETVQYVVVHGAIAVDAQGPATLYSDLLRIHHQGFIGFPWAEGTIQTQNESIALSGDQVILGGNLHLRPIGFETTHAPQLTLLGDGTVDYVRIGVDAKTIANAEAAAVAGGAAAGLGVLALAVYFWPTLKWASSLLLFPLYARVPKENTLDHKGRELLYDLIKNEPGVSTNKLAREVPFGWSTLTYHLRVLERNEAIVSVRDGRYKRFFDRQSGRFANGRKYILATLKNDATFEIARYIREKPGSSQKEVATHFQLSPSSVHWHVERLTEVGLVQKSREAHNVKYTPGEAWDHVTVEDLKALEAAGPEPPEDPSLMKDATENAPGSPTTTPSPV